MRAIVAPGRPFHSVMMCNEFASRNYDVSIISSASRKYFQGLDERIKTKFAPMPFAMLEKVTGLPLGGRLARWDALIYDKVTKGRLGDCDFFVGWATLSLFTATEAIRRGAKFVLDRACPHVDFQENMNSEEALKTGYTFQRLPDWFIERQKQEYECADLIVVPSSYTRETFPEALHSKIVVAPLFGKFKFPEKVHAHKGNKFVVGVIGNDSLRKGYFYLLQAWRRLNLPNSVLKIRNADGFGEHPVLKELISSSDNVELVDYIDDMNAFYQSCDVFILPSVDDGFGMALIEAMANGVACIATRHCGASELLTSGQNAEVIEARSIGEIERTLEKLYREEAYRSELGTAARAYVSYLRVDGTTHLYRAAVDQLVARLG